jgi:hypothetical protein
VARLNPATSLVIREWDSRGCQSLDLRSDLLEVFRAEGQRRETEVLTFAPAAEHGGQHEVAAAHS